MQGTTETEEGLRNQIEAYGRECGQAIRNAWLPRLRLRTRLTTTQVLLVSLPLHLLKHRRNDRVAARDVYDYRYQSPQRGGHENSCGSIGVVWGEYGPLTVVSRLCHDAAKIGISGHEPPAPV